MNRGFASATGTRRYAAAHAAYSYRSLGRTGLEVSEAGFGGYRVDSSVQVHRQALEYALRSGINLIDTSANYADGGSERLVGQVLSKLIESGKLGRDEVVIVSKGGYLQGENLKLSRQRKGNGDTYPELVVFDEGLEHCIHPVFLEEQLSRSLQRMQLDHIDGYLLHNPEYYLKWAKNSGFSAEAASAEYLRRIRAAFRYLEEEVETGRIGFYGISSNTLPKSAADYEFTSLSAICQLAEEISPQHHFRLIEFPCNLIETGAITEKNQPGGKSLLEYAQDKQVATLINRPLNAIQDEQLVRLADNVYKGDVAERAAAFRERIASMDPAWHGVSSLSHLALRALRSTSGVGSVLVGMRRQSYVEDVLAELRQQCPVGERREAWQAMTP